MIFLSNNKILKKVLISLILIILLSNFCIPNYVQADVGGALAKPIFQFIAWIGNIVISFLQDTFYGYDVLQNNVDGSYSIYYSPYNIFAGNVPGLSINFINPDADTRTLTVTPMERVHMGTAWDLWEDTTVDSNYDTEKSVVKALRIYDYRGIDWERLYPQGITPTTQAITGDIKFDNVSHNADFETEAASAENWGNEYIFTKDTNGMWVPTDGIWKAELLVKIIKKSVANGDYLSEHDTDFSVTNPDNGVTEYELDEYNSVLKFNANGNKYDICYYEEMGNHIVFAFFNENYSKAYYFWEGSNIDDFDKIMDKEIFSDDIKLISTLDQSQLQNPDDLQLDYAQLRQDDVFTYKWLMEKSKQGIIWESPSDGETYILTLDYTTDVETNGMPIIGRFLDEETYVIEATLAKELRGTISKWYKALRTLALVGLLSVLVYIGIRIIISSSSEDKAKYKKMIGNWLAAICIIFILHYMMVLMLEISSKITNVISNTMSNEITRDEAMSSFRSQFERSDDFLDMLVIIICYVTLVVYTCVFTIQYLKRVIYMAFLTMVAPLIALTYPIDKLKDGKAQAFSMWLKEYIFNCLLQPVHLLLYTILVTSMGTEFIKTYPIYAIVAIGFLIPAEKFFRKMFGMESQTPVGTIGAAAGGAMIMGMINKLRGKPPKDEEKEGKQGVRTASQNGGKAVEGAGQATETGGKAVEGAGKGISAGGKAIQAGSAIPYVGPVIGAVGKGVDIAGKAVQGAGKGIQGAGKGIKTAGKATQKLGKATSKIKKVTTVAGQKFKRVAKKTGGKIHKVGKKYVYGSGSRARKNRRAIRRTITGAAGGILGATIGIAAGVASGDLGKAFSYGTAGAAAGYAGAKNLGDNISSKVQGAHDKIRKASMGTEAYNNAKFDEKFFESDDYKIFKEKHGENAKQIAQSYLNCGITDTKEMEKLIGSGIDANAYSQYKQNGVTDVAKMAELGKADISPELYGAFANEGITDIYKIKKAKKYAEGKKLNETQVAERMRIVQNVPEEAKNDEAKFGEYINRLARGKNWSQKEIEEMRKDLYKNLYDLT